MRGTFEIDEQLNEQVDGPVVCVVYLDFAVIQVFSSKLIGSVFGWTSKVKISTK
jgi:hypothetical protein